MQYAQRDPDYSGVGFLPVPLALDGGINKLYIYVLSEDVLVGDEKKAPRMTIDQNYWNDRVMVQAHN
jgi:hypothetical protein